MKKPLHVLIVEDSEDDALLLVRELTRGGYDVTARRVETAEEFRTELANKQWEAILSDYALPRFSGEAALRMARESGLDLPFIFVSGTMGEDIAVGAMKAGAHDYVMKGNLTRLLPAMERELRDAIERRQHRNAELQMKMSEHKYRHLFRSMSDAALLISADSDRVIDANEQAEILFGRTRDRLLGLESARLCAIPTGSGESALAEVPPHLAGGFESVVSQPGGATVAVHVVISHIQLYERPLRLVLFRDISERKRTEAALRNVLRHARTIVAEAEVTAPPGWNPADGTGRAADFLWTWHFPDAATAQEVLPLDVPADRYQEGWDAAKDPDDKARIAVVAERAFAAGESGWQMEFRCLDRQGRRHVFTQAAFIEITDCGHWRVTTINKDITARVEAEEALRMSEERLATIFTLSPTAICIVRSSDNRFVDVNEAFIKGCGYARQELIGRTPDELRLWEDAAERGAILREVQARGTAVAFKLKGRRKNGEVGVGLSSMTRIILNGEEHLLSLIQDITELERAEEARRESDRRFRQLAESIDEVFWLTDVDKQQMIYISPAYRCIWGRTCESLYAAPQSWLEAVHPEDRERVRAALKLQAGGDYDIEYRIVRPDGSIRSIHERAFPVKDVSGITYRIAGVASDITVRRELEEQFRQAQKMEAVGQLAGGIAHDFNNLLTVIQLQSSFLADMLHSNHEAEQGVRQIMDAANRAANLTRQLLTFSRRQTPAARDIDLGEVLGGMTKMLRRILGEDISMESRLAPGLPCVHADPGMMEQILMNLAINARDAMPTGGRLTISLDRVVIEPAQAAQHPPATAGPFVCLTVSDTGCGIAPEIRSRIFEPFFTTKEIGRGTGLGLATVFGIVKQHQGWIELDSEVGKGTAFRVFLPAKIQAQREVGAAEVTSPVPGGSESILLVEDEETVRTLAATALRQLGYRVIEAGTVAEALQQWETAGGKVDLLLTDLIMPGGLSGQDLAERLFRKAPELRVIYTTGFSSSPIASQMHLEKGLNFLAKPYSFSELAEMVRHQLDAVVSRASS
jgi:PAS domain S-box-containing protein